MPPELALPQAELARATGVPQAWRTPLAQLALAWAVLILLTESTWAEMARQWWNASTYNHILLIPPILAWLVRLRWPELARLRPIAWWPPLLWLFGGALAWALGTAGGINLIAQVGAVMLLQAAATALIGPKAAAALAFPLGYMLFLVPFGDEIMPPLQAITAHLAVALTHAGGVPATLSGVFIDTPVGRFEVARACSGVKFLIAMVALGTLVAHLGFRSARRRAILLAACVAVPILANGVRAWGTIAVAQSRGVAFAAGFDHIVYGWIFFALVMALVLGVASRYHDRDPSERPIDTDSLEASPVLNRLSEYPIRGWTALATIVLVAALAAVPGVALLRPLVAGWLAAAGLRP